MTYVDRIATEYITSCPHGKDVKCIEEFGVKIFIHGDGTQCSLLNSIILHGSDLNEEDAFLLAKKSKIKSVFDLIEDPSCYARLTTDEELVKWLADELEKERSIKRLESFFLKLAKQKNIAKVIESLSKYCDRNTLLNNVTAVYTKYRDSEDIEHCLPIVLEYLKLNKK